MDKLKHMKNPLLIGLAVGIAVYLYLKWEADRKHSEDPESKKKPVNLLIPASAGAMSWFAASTYLAANQCNSISSNVPGSVQPAIPAADMALMGGMVRQAINQDVLPPVNDVANSPAITSFELVRKRKVKLPAADVFLDIGNF